MRIAIFADNFYPELSGVADSVWLSGLALAKKGHKVTFFVPKYGEREYRIAGAAERERPSHENVRIVRITSFGYKTATGQGRGTLPNPFRALFHHRAFDVVHTHSFFALGIEAYLLARIEGIPLVGTNHTVIESFLEFAPSLVRKLLPKYQIWFYNRCTSVTVPSAAILEKVRREGLVVPADVISNPVEERCYVHPEEKAKHRKDDRFTYLYVGRISPEKNVRALVDGFVAFLDSTDAPGAELLLVGGGIERDALQEHIDELGLRDRIKILGPYIGERKTVLYEIYDRADVFVTASLSEVQPMTILHAMASSMPSLVARSHSLPEMIGEDKGLVFDADDRDSLVAALRTAYKERERMRAMGGVAHASVADLRAHAIADKWERFHVDVSLAHHEARKLSLIISAHNEEKYIGEALQHIIEDAPHLLHEIIVVDNASTDRTAEVASRYPGVRVVREEEKGLTKARQRGYKEATGDIQAYLDADGHMPRGWTKRVLRAFADDEKLVCFSGPALYHDVSRTKGALVRAYWLISYATYFFVGYMAQGGNFVLTKQALDEVGGFDTSIAFYGEDTNIARRASEIGKVKFTLALPMYTSGRRFRGQGLAKTAYLYVRNFFGEVLFKKPTTEEYIDIR